MSKSPIFERASFRSLQGDKAVMEWIAGNVDKLMPDVSAASGLGALEGLSESVGTELVREKIETLSSLGGLESGPGVFGLPEAIIQKVGRPPLLIKKGSWVEPTIPELKKRLNSARKQLEAAIPKVARIDVLNIPGVPYMGTGWMIDDGIMVTNRHVAELFAYKKGGRFVLKTTPVGTVMKLEVDFKEEFRAPGEAAGKPFVAELVEVIYIAENGESHPDMALLRIKRSAGLPDPIELSTKLPSKKDDVAVIGYPAEDGSRNDPQVMAQLFEDIYNVKRLSPGKVTVVGGRKTFLCHDCTTLGGNSGSVVMGLDEGKAVGLHFAGEFLTNNFAVTSRTVLDTLGRVRLRSSVSVPAHVPGSETVPSSAELKKRKGYDAGFLGQAVPLPTIGKHTLAPVTGRTDNLLHYLHFSVAVHKTRKLALYTAVNIDGNKLYNIRRSRDVWNLDPRMEAKFQTGPALYQGNSLDRGHLVRRLDPAWGDTRPEAIQAADDTFFYTNSTPQHSALNQQTWLGLEEFIMDNAKTHDLKVTVFTGPVFASNDREYRGVRIPEEYWKVVAIINSDTNELSATAYLLSQAELIEDLEFAFGAYKTYQLPISKLEKKTGLSFGDLSQYDPLRATESLGAMVVQGPEDIRL